MRPRRGARAWSMALAGAASLVAAAAGSAAETNVADDSSFIRSRRVDPAGLTLLGESRRRAPSGFLYPYPWEPPDRRDLGAGWTASGFAEVGWAGSWGASSEAYFDRYSDRDDGILDAFRVELRHGGRGAFAELGARQLGRDDASAFVDAGLRGRLRLRAVYDALPHRYAGDARLLFDGLGGENLQLPAGLVAGGNTDAAIDAALAGRGRRRLALQRERAGLSVEFQANSILSLSAGYRSEERRGERPFGGAIRFAFPNPNLGSVVETAEPLDSRSHDFHGGLAISTQHVALELGYEGSVFDNGVQSLTWENPFPNTNVDRGRFALAPDNHQHRFHGTLSYALPMRGRWTNTLSWISARQDAKLLAPTLNDAFPDWLDPATALSRDRADARVDTTRFTSTLRLSPLRRLSVGADVRYHRRDNRTRWTALNPATGQFGYVIEDGSFGIAPRYAALPFDREELSAGASATLRLRSRSRVSLEYEYEQIEREQRARARTRAHTGRLSLSTRRLPKTTLRLSYEVSQRGGSSFDRERDAVFYSAGPPDFSAPPIGTPQRSLSSFEQHDLSDRWVHAGQARFGFQLGEVGDLALAGGVRHEDYAARHGLQWVRAANANLELTLQPSPGWDAYAFGGFEWRERELDTLDSASFLGSDFRPGGPVFPLDHAWSTRSRQRGYSAGAGLSARPLAVLELRIDYWLSIASERLSYDFASVAALAPGTAPDAVGSRFPDLRSADHVVDVSARLELAAGVAARVLYRFQRSTIDDPQQAGLVPRIGRTLYLAHVDGDFTAHVVGGSLELSF